MSRKAITEHLNNYQSVVYVYPTHYEAQREFLHVTAMIPASDTDYLHKHLSIVRTNPNSRIATVIRFISADTDPDTTRGMKAIIQFPTPLRYSHPNKRRWEQAQQFMERHRK